MSKYQRIYQEHMERSKAFIEAVYDRRDEDGETDE